jgi:hypothetical protein
MQPLASVAPFSEKVDAGQGTSAVPSQKWPGGVDMQLDEPATLWPLVHGVQVSVAPVLKWFSGHSMVPSRRSLAL